MIRTYKSGNVTEKSKFWVPKQTKRRSPKQAASSPRKQDENDRDAIKRLARLINCNFSHGDLWLTLSYSAEGYAAIDAETPDAVKLAADKQLTLFLRRMRREMDKLGMEFRYICLTSDMDGGTGEMVRPHHHILMPRAAYDLCVKHWHLGSVDYQLLREQEDYSPLAVYLVKQCRRALNENRWKASRNLIQPTVTETETYEKGILRAPAGAKLIDSGHYDEESGNHYIRYIAKPKQKKGGHKEGRKDGIDLVNGEAVSV